MKEIFYLIKSDFITMKKKAIIPFLAVYAAVLGFSFCSSPAIPLMIIPVSGFMIQPIFRVEAENGGIRLFGVLPVKRRNIVIARFILTFIIMIIISAVSLFFAKLFCEASLAPTLGGVWAEAYETKVLVEEGGMLMMSMFFIFGSIIFSYDYAIIYIFGTSKETIASMIGMISLVAGMFVIIYFFEVDIYNAIYRAADILAKNELLFYALCSATGAVIFAIGAAVSVYSYCKKEI